LINSSRISLFFLFGDFGLGLAGSVPVSDFFGWKYGLCIRIGRIMNTWKESRMGSGSSSFVKMDLLWDNGILFSYSYFLVCFMLLSFTHCFSRQAVFALLLDPMFSNNRVFVFKDALRRFHTELIPCTC
jgi:hypothetical protein